jgi:hypothetical protein
MRHHVIIVASAPAIIIIIKGGTAGTFEAAFPVDLHLSTNETICPNVQQSYLYFMF